jgi:hypothetical protein
LAFDPAKHEMFTLDGTEELEKKIVMGLQWRLENGSDTTKTSASRSYSSSSASTKGGGGGEKGRSDQGYILWGEKSTSTSKAENFTLQVQSFVFLLAQTDSSRDKTAMARVGMFNDRLLALGMRIMQYLLVGLQSRKSVFLVFLVLFS